MPAKNGKGKGLAAFLSSILELDRRLSKLLAVCSHPRASYGSARPLMIMLEYSGHGVPWFLAMCVMIFLSGDAGLVNKLYNLLFLSIFDVGLLLGVKAVVRRERPRQNMNDQTTYLSDKYSFPSGHATRSAMVATFVLDQFDWGPLVNMIVVGWAVCCCLSRVMLARHHVSDVVFGAAIGIIEYQHFKSSLWVSAENNDIMLKQVQKLSDKFK